MTLNSSVAIPRLVGCISIERRKESALAGKGLLRVIGLMSGTSLDGVDAALLKTDGQTIAGFGGHAFIPYSEAEQSALRSVLGMWPDRTSDALRRAEAIIQTRHLEAITALLPADLIGFHGQTLVHDPAAGRTHQLGDGETLARAAGVATVWDFRTADMKAGGQGAPLVPFFHHALALRVGFHKPVVFLNIGGVANLTRVDPVQSDPANPDALLAFDCGPGNALINDFMQQVFGTEFDRDGQIAASGRVDQDRVQRWLEPAFFSKRPPKSLDRDNFGANLREIGDLTACDAVATLTAFTAAAVARAMTLLPGPVPDIWVCGGGRRNSTLLAMIAEKTGVAVRPVEDVGLDGDMLEAQAFAWLAARVKLGLPTSAPQTTGCSRPVCGGILSLPGHDRRH